MIDRIRSMEYLFDVREALRRQAHRFQIGARQIGRDANAGKQPKGEYAYDAAGG